MSVLPFVLAAANAISPNKDHTVIAEAIARAIECGPALFQNDDDLSRTAALAVAVAFQEGSLGTRVEGDFRGGKPTSWCTFQIHIPSGRTREGWTGPELRDDAVKCATVGLRMLRESARVCRTAPVAWYAVGGTKACASPRGLRISRDRVALATRLHAAATAALAAESST